MASSIEVPPIEASTGPVEAQDSTLLELLLEATTDGIMDWDLRANVVRYTSRWTLMLGYENEPATSGRPLWKELSHPDDLPRAEESLADHLENLWPFYHTWRMRHHNGEWRWVFCRAVTARDANLRPLRTVAVFTDITDRVRAEERQRAMVTAVPDLLLRVGAGGVVLDIKLPESLKAADPRLTWPASGARLHDWPAAAEWCERVMAYVERPMAGAGGERQGSECFEAALTWPGVPVRSAEIRVVHSGENEAVCIIRDITEQRQMQSQLLQNQKLEAIGQLAAGIAHEINTPMQYIGDNLNFVRDGVGSLVKVLDACWTTLDGAQQAPIEPAEMARLRGLQDEEDLEFLRTRLPTSVSLALEGVDRVSRIVRAMKEFSHPGGVEKAPVDLNRELETTITISTHVWKHVATIERDFDPELPPVSCHRGEINQVVLNLIVNAAHAIADTAAKGGPEKGRISVSTRANGRFAEIRVADTGGGIPEKIRHRIFEPFFTTKEVGRGTGQGLSMARNTVVARHGGTLEFDTKEGKGTTFIVQLPFGAP